MHRLSSGDWLEPALRAGVNVDVIVDEGNIPTRILEFGDTLRPDLVVMGTHGLGGFDRFILGSITEKVLRKSACPVLTVPPAAGAIRIPYKRLLCPVDFSESSLAALRFATSIAKETDASLTIAHVFDWPSGDAFMERFNEPEFRRLVEQDARERLEALVTDDLRTWCRPATAIAHGKAYREILAIAAREDADLIVMGVRGRNPVDLMLFGSTTNHVVRAATCPVLTLKQ
jgi:CPA2 family monovalent cation:H+ antiporter-2